MTVNNPPRIVLPFNVSSVGADASCQPLKSTPNLLLPKLILSLSSTAIRSQIDRVISRHNAQFSELIIFILQDLVLFTGEVSWP
ncbi:MAG: hypothetical protein ACRETL_04555, partial [Gammaproteobacteria bacterium]